MSNFNFALGDKYQTILYSILYKRTNFLKNYMMFSTFTEKKKEWGKKTYMEEII